MYGAEVRQYFHEKAQSETTNNDIKKNVPHKDGTEFLKALPLLYIKL
jgi:hypothetical protein